MAQTFKETAHLNTDQKKFDEGHNRIFGNNKQKIHMEKWEDGPVACGQKGSIKSTSDHEKVTCHYCIDKMDGVV